MIAVGILFGAQAVIQMQSLGLSLNNPLLVGTLGTVAGFIVTGVMFIAFGTVIRLLQEIRDNTTQI